jgi:hypothetical protein
MPSMAGRRRYPLFRMCNLAFENQFAADWCGLLPAQEEVGAYLISGEFDLELNATGSMKNLAGNHDRLG